MATSAPTRQQEVHLAVTLQVRPGQEEEFEAALVRFIQKSLDFPGTTGVNLIRPAPGTDCREYGILRSFLSEKHSRAFYESEMFHDYKAETKHLVEGEANIRPLHGLEAFFRAGRSAPPRWKMALVTWLGVFPAVLFWSQLVGPPLHMLPAVLVTAISTVLVTITLTWFVMPLLTKMFRPWLVKK
ncbi:Antibiotic biosynthesis monooxygenase [Polystyrenella longa]|uniref:Antibiotic biosynthesis monooxygenase n=1 Tax=Polystyrenella longa TaxID=2528007 RepID=A0A518CS33_9PLAN|nr:antibiotic biosynthesis monooxygenase [Polystyrenella longa]QDU82041.1 Antibiotic biosynthesis monooxygenase [Polystyrenella longa]